MGTRRILRSAALALFGALALLSLAAAQETVKLADIIELSGAGATVGTNWKNGIDLAVKQINAKGGILGRKLVVTHYDTQTNPGVSKAVLTKALDEKPYVVLGPIFSGSTKVNMSVTQQAEVPQICGSEADDITAQGDPYIFRTSFRQAAGMPKIANYLRDVIKARSVAVVYVNNDFGKGGRDAILKELQARDIKVVADVSTEQQQIDFTSDVLKVKNSAAEALFVYLNEEESARILKELRKQGYARPVVGETTLLNQKVIELAGEAANGVRGHVGLSAEAPVASIREMAAAFEKEYHAKPDHNGIKGYFAVYVVKAVTEKMGKFDSKLFARTLHGMTISAKSEPGVLMDVTFDDKGDLDRESFLAEVKDGKQVITAVLPPLGKR